MENITQEEFDRHYQRIYNRLCFINDPDKNNRQYIESRVKLHFELFLNDFEKENITQLIFQNYKENYGYISGVDLPNGYTIHWELQCVVSSAKTQCNTKHMDTYYSEEYKRRFLDIIKTKRL